MRIFLLTVLHLTSALPQYAESQYGGANFPSWLEQPPPFQRPVDIMTDVVNDLGIKILQQYADNGNVAFSPTGVGFVLAALYEGSAGDGSQQIADALRLPWNRDVTRVGLRDIHRRLRSYLSADGFLGGLTLNKENTKLRPEYEDILQFYGFDLSSSESESNVTEGTTSLPEGATAAGDNGGSTEASPEILTTVKSTTGVDDGTGDEPTPTEMTLTSRNSGDEAVVETVTESVQTSSTPEGEGDDETSTIPDSVMKETQEISTENVQTTTTASNMNTEQATRGSEEDSVVTTTNPTRETRRTSTNSGKSSTETNVVTETVTANSFGVDAVTILNGSPETPAPALVTADLPDVTTTSTPLTTEPETTETNPETSTQENSDGADAASGSSVKPAIETTTIENLTGDDVTTIEDSGTDVTTIASDDDRIIFTTEEIGTIAPTEDPVIRAVLNVSAIPTDEMVEPTSTSNDFIDGTTVDPNETTTTLSTVTSTDEDVASTIDETTEPSKMLDPDDDTSSDPVRSRSTRSPRSYFSNFPDEGMWMQDVGLWRVHSSTIGEAALRDSAELSFLVNGCEVTPVSAAAYTAVLPFAFLPTLQALALEFPLDDPRYNILLVLPADRNGSQRLARDLGTVTLRELRKELQPAWVRAMIPSFMLRGFVTLTPFLQRMGIRDVFEPRVADLSPMSTEIGVYARDVQQSIAVNIRNYMKPDRTHSRNGLFERAGPVSFTAEHPFLYFIIDAQTGVSLIAGRIDDPLNSRIL